MPNMMGYAIRRYANYLRGTDFVFKRSNAFDSNHDV